ncbi:MAG: hypothetical protein JXB48_09735 [Candidatus Latescibacteria bacterium]|nr:hypothetical protein [Candidatus Latescibacterota bacterium]
MGKYLVLLRKELKNMYRELLLFLGFQIGYLVIVFMLRRFTGYEFPNRPSGFHKFIMDAFNFSPFLLPAILVYSLYIEERTGTIYQACSLPLRRNLLRIKFLVVLGAMIALAVVIITHTVIGFSMGHVHATPEAAVSGILWFFTYPYISLCLVSVSWGCMQLVQKNRLLVGLVAGIVGFGVYLWLSDVFWMYIKRNVLSPLNNGYFYVSVYTLVMGIVFACTGFMLYERYSEV